MILSGKCAGHEGVRSGASSEPPLCLGRKRSSHVPRCSGHSTAAPGGEATPCQCTLLQAFYSVLRFCLPFAKLLCFACILESMEWDEGELFPQRRASIVQKAAQTERWIRFLAKGGAGRMWREIGMFLGKKAECFLNELQNQVSCRHQCLWGGQDCVSCPLLQWVPRIPVWKSLFRESYVLLWCGRHFPFHILSITVLFSVLNSHWQKLFLSDH